ncbi:hypothetical protein L208DRAFT_1233431 [Tricholoma matsutake]|nr:hypothetical protein L208DRAFT_1233431 [Tricholoma matsutake 945]
MCPVYSAQNLKLRDMRKHVGKHILAAFRGAPYPWPLKPGMDIVVDPCGWCEREGCKTIVQGKSQSILSSCPYHYAKMSYSRALPSTKSLPCTNVPIHCQICPESLSGQPRTIWKYNAMNHFVAEHKPDGEKLADISPLFLVEAFITSKEEKWLGIPQDTIQKSKIGEMNMRFLIQMVLKKSVLLRHRSENELNPTESVVSTQPLRKNVKTIGL